MGANFKRELILGIVSILLFTTLIIVHTLQYQNRKIKSLTPIKTTNLTQPAIISGAPGQTSQQLTSDLVASHNTANDCWIIVQNKVYSVSSYLTQHPGGADRIIPYCGQEATQAFVTRGGSGSHSQNAYNILGAYYVGELNGAVLQQQQSTGTNAVQTAPVRPAGSGRSNDDD